MSRCRSCQAEIIWAITEAGKRIPLDDEPALETPAGLFTLDSNWPGEGGPRAISAAAGARLYRSHFATCPNADQHRKLQ